MRPTLLAASPALAGLLWTVALIVDHRPLSASGSLLLGVGLMGIGTVSTIGMIVVGGRWAHRLAYVAIAAGAAAAVIRAVDGWWLIAAIATAASLVALLSPALASTIRKLPSASGPPPRAIAPALLLLAAPVPLGLAAATASDWAAILVGGTAPVFAFGYARVLPGGLLGVRVVWPALAVSLAPFLGLAGALTAVAIALATAGTAWGSSVRASYHPPREVGSTFAIPPELAPDDVLDAADIDERGRPR